MVDSGRRRRWTEAAELKDGAGKPFRAAPHGRDSAPASDIALASLELAQGMARGSTCRGSRRGFVPAIVTPEPEAAGKRSRSEESRVEIVTANARPRHRWAE